MFEQKLNLDPTIHKIISSIGQIDELKGAFRQTPSVFEPKSHIVLRESAQQHTIAATLRMDGIQVADWTMSATIRAARTPEKLRKTKIGTYSEQQVTAYYHTLDAIATNYKTIDLDVAALHHFHTLLFRFDKAGDKLKHDTGSVIKITIIGAPNDNLITEKYESSQADFAEKLTELCAWVNKSMQAHELHPLLVIATFLYEILLLKPYKNENYRIANLFTHLLLLKAGYSFMAQASLFLYIEEHKKEFLTILSNAEKSRNRQKVKINDWFLFFLDALSAIATELKPIANHKKFNAMPLGARQSSIFNFIIEHQPVRIKTVENHFLEYSNSVIRKEIAFLLQKGRIAQEKKEGRNVYIADKNAIAPSLPVKPVRDPNKITIIS